MDNMHGRRLKSPKHLVHKFEEKLNFTDSLLGQPDALPLRSHPVNGLENYEQLLSPLKAGQGTITVFREVN